MNPPSSSAPPVLRPLPREGLRGSAGIILHILLFLSTLLIGIGITSFQPVEELTLRLPEVLAAVSMLFLVLHLWRAARTAKGTIPLLITVGVILTLYTNSLLPAGILCGLIFTVSEGSLLIALQPKGRLALLPLIPLLAYGAVLLLSRAPIASLSVLLPWPAAWALAVGTRRSAASEEGPNRVGVICGTALALGLTAAALLAVALLKALGTPDLSVLPQAMEQFRLDLIREFYAEPMPEGLSAELIELWEEMHTYANIENTVNQVINLLPAIVTVIALVIATVCQSVQHAALRAFGYEECLTDRVKAFEMSLLSCVVFLAAALSMLMDRGTTSSFFGMVAQNLYIILLPGLSLAGLLRITRSLTKKGPRAMGCLFYVIILGFCLLFFAPMILAAVEVIGHIFAFVSSKLAFDEDDDDPFGNG